MEAKSSLLCSTVSAAMVPVTRKDPFTVSNSAIEAFTGRNDARNKGDEALGFGNGAAIDRLTEDIRAIRPVAFSSTTSW